jgi:hypothetical protein
MSSLSPSLPSPPPSLSSCSYSIGVDWMADKRILELYLEAVATKDNVDLLYHIAGKIKTVRDVSIPIPDLGSDSEEDIPGDEGMDKETRDRIRRNKRVAKANSVSLAFFYLSLAILLIVEPLLPERIDSVDHSK